ncbi:MAG: adenylate cyclase [Bacilli bacterium]|nr:adenylate cyclase [Bacilli bacterium]
MKEIERKFLVTDASYKSRNTGILYKQGYLNSDFERTVRVRVTDREGFITIKSKNIGLTRAEFEYEIPLDDANEMIHTLCEKPIIEKIRYKIEYKGVVWEVDEFLGENQGLVIAEIELGNETDEVVFPEWLGREVSQDTKYYNSNLIRHPFKHWEGAKFDA